MVEKLLFEKLKNEIQGIDIFTNQNDPNKSSITSHFDWWKDQITTMNEGTFISLTQPRVFLEFPDEVVWNLDGSGLLEAAVSFRIHIIQEQATDISTAQLSTTIAQKMNNLDEVETILERFSGMAVLNNNTANQSDYDFDNYKPKYNQTSDEFTKPVHKQTIHGHTNTPYSDTILVFDTMLKNKAKLKKWKRHNATVRPWSKGKSDHKLNLQPKDN